MASVATKIVRGIFLAFKSGQLFHKPIKTHHQPLWQLPYQAWVAVFEKPPEFLTKAKFQIFFGKIIKLGLGLIHFYICAWVFILTKSVVNKGELQRLSAVAGDIDNQILETDVAPKNASHWMFDNQSFFVS